MAKTILTTAKGSSVGPYSNRFNIEIQLAYEGVTATGYNMYIRYRVNVTANPTGSTFTSNLHCSWTDKTYSLGGGTGYQVDSGWISLGHKTFGTKVSQYGKCYYTGSSSTYTSDATASYTVPYPTYTVTYNGNGGSGVPDAQTKTHGTNITLSSIIPIKKGYKFLGWGTSAEDTSVDYSPGSIYSSNASITLYAIWKKLNNMAINENGEIKKGKPWLNQKSGTPWININGVWKKGE